MRFWSLLAACAAAQFSAPEVDATAVAGAPGYTLDVPLVFAHGMGDSCFNPGMKQITEETGKRYSTYAACIPHAGSAGADAADSFFADLEHLIEDFAAKVKADATVAKAKKFHAVGFSQGNLMIRGYVQKYNLHEDYPQVESWVSMHGPMLGVSGFPHCKPGENSTFCSVVAKILGGPAYWEVTQAHLVQAGYYRLPTAVDKEAFKKHSRIARLNGEAEENPAMADAKKNFASLKQLTLVKALKDTMVEPNDSEWFGYFKDGSLNTADIVPMKDTKFYQQNSFGLKDLDAKKAISYGTTPGDHMQFTFQDLVKYTDVAFKPSDETVVV